jgi:uncharacterized protein
VPGPVRELRQWFYPRLLPIARDWAGRLGRPAPWPDTLGEWVELCHRAGQGKSAQILLRYECGDWNALHRDLFGDLVFPLQVVIGLDEYGTTRDRPVRSARGWSASPVRHGVSTVRSGHRRTLGIVFHDA